MNCKTILTTDEIAGYSRQIRRAEVGKEGQEKLKASSALVIVQVHQAALCFNT